MWFLLCDIELEWCIVGFLLGVLSFFILIVTVMFTQIVFIVRCIKHSKTLFSQILYILYAEFIQSLCMFVHYMVILSIFNPVYILIEYFDIFYETQIFYYFTTQTSLISDKSFFKKKLGLPLVVFNLLYTTGFVIYMLVLVNEDKDEIIYYCNDPIWTYLHLCEFLLVIGFFVIGITVQKQLKELKEVAEYELDTNREKEFWLVIIGMLLESIFGLLNNLYFLSMGQNKCEFFTGSLALNIVLFLFKRLSTDYILIFIMIYVFWPEVSNTGNRNRLSLIHSQEDVHKTPQSSSSNLAEIFM